jgi:Histidine phosphatase superfamily (branch 2)
MTRKSQQMVSRSIIPTVMIWAFIGFAHGQNQYTVQMVTNVFRHGARTPVTNYLNYQWANNIGIGNLTFGGMRQHYYLGAQLQKNYSALLNPTAYTNFDVQVMSSPLMRTVQSAQSHLQGVYSPGLTNDPNTGFGPQTTSNVFVPPITPYTYTFNQDKAVPFGFGMFPVSTDTDYLDFYFMVPTSCPNFYPSVTTARKDIDPTYNKLVQPTCDKLQGLGFNPQQFQQSTCNLTMIEAAYDCLVANRFYNGQNDAGLSDDFYTELTNAKSINSVLYFPTDQTINMFTNNISRSIIDGMNDKIAGKTQLKYRVFSGHDTTLTPLMMKLDLISLACLKGIYPNGVDPNCQTHPPYASTLIFELVTNQNNNYFVRILYNGQPVAPICSNPVDQYYCDFNSFQTEFSNRMYLNNFLEICGNQYYQVSTLRSSLVVLVVGLGLASLAGLILVVQYSLSYLKLSKRWQKVQQITV